MDAPLFVIANILPSNKPTSILTVLQKFLGSLKIRDWIRLFFAILSKSSDVDGGLVKSQGMLRGSGSADPDPFIF